MTTSQSTLKQLPDHGACFICGSQNPHNLGIHWFVNEKGVVSAEFRLTEAQQGPPGHAHGGASAAVLDEVMGAAVWQAGYVVVAANLEVSYRKPVPLGQPLTTRGRITRRNGRKIYARGEICLPDGTVAVLGRGLYIIRHDLFENIHFMRPSEEGK